MEIRPDLIEWDYGTYEGRTPEQITAERSDWSLWHQGPPGGETLDAVQRRLDRVVADLRTSTGDIAVFAHRDVLRVLAARWIGVAALTGRHLVLATGTISVLGWERDTPCILSWNQPAHRS